MDVGGGSGRMGRRVFGGVLSGWAGLSLKRSRWRCQIRGSSALLRCIVIRNRSVRRATRLFCYFNRFFNLKNYVVDVVS